MRALWPSIFVAVLLGALPAQAQTADSEALAAFRLYCLEQLHTLGEVPELLKGAGAEKQDLPEDLAAKSEVWTLKRERTLNVSLNALGSCGVASPSASLVGLQALLEKDINVRFLGKSEGGQFLYAATVEAAPDRALGHGVVTLGETRGPSARMVLVMVMSEAMLRAANTPLPDWPE